MVTENSWSSILLPQNLEEKRYRSMLYSWGLTEITYTLFFHFWYLIVGVLLWKVLPFKAVFDNIMYRYRYITDFMMVNIKLLNIEMKETNSCCTGVHFEYKGILSYKITYSKYDAPSKIRNTPCSERRLIGHWFCCWQLPVKEMCLLPRKILPRGWNS
jgi:hypothetical protein